ncbi:TMhelix containing protein [Vibrio phage 1.077.O._10N.261.45.A10]|nr:TMhelix containing protein [Vibrio phage 1.077.O._10N.261.45.A10]
MTKTLIGFIVSLMVFCAAISFEARADMQPGAICYTPQAIAERELSAYRQGQVAAQQQLYVHLVRLCAAREVVELEGYGFIGCYTGEQDDQGN